MGFKKTKGNRNGCLREARRKGHVRFLFIHYDDENVIEPLERIRNGDTCDILTITRIFDGTRFDSTDVFFTQERRYFGPTSLFSK
jgi:hypothetical protein